jgi:PleD family two-component response regulator/EAL domain-containing protein (putative c-di-GMP-specific phosphodiesterase class I)
MSPKLQWYSLLWTVVLRSCGNRGPSRQEFRVAVSSDVQQNRQAQLKQAFAEHLPQRIASVQRRTFAMCEGGWDINTLHLIYNEVQQLAGSSGSYGLVRASDKLLALEVYLSSFTESGLIPVESQTNEIQSLVAALDEISGGSQQEPKSRKRSIAPRSILVAEALEPIIELSGLPAAANVPVRVIPPLEFLPFDELPESPIGEHVETSGADRENGDSEEFSDPDIERLMEGDINLSVGNIAEKLVSSEDHFKVMEHDEIGEAYRDDVAGGGGTTELSLAEEMPFDDEFDADEDIEGLVLEDKQPVVEAVGELPGKSRTIYFLRAASKRMNVLAEGLEPEFEVHSFDDVEEFREILGALGPDAVLIDDEFFGEMEVLAPLIKKLRKKQSRPMPMVAFSDSSDIATRLKVLRAGADAFLASDVEPSEVSRRLGELTLAAIEEPYRILIIEDDRSQAVFAQGILRKSGMKVKLERNPMKALDTLEEFEPDLILMDLYMPDCDGMELTSIIREREQFINTPIVFLSGENDTDKHFDALLAGGDDFLAKPIRPRHLIQAVTNRVRRARQLNRQRPAAGGAGGLGETSTGLVERPVLLGHINALLADMENIDPDLPGGVIFIELNKPYELRREIGLKGFESLTSQLAPLLSEELARDESVARYGDNAHCILIPGRSEASVRALAQDLVTRIGKHPFNIGKRTARTSICSGVCMLSSQLADAGATIALAERACRPEKLAGDTSSARATKKAESLPEENDQELALLIQNAIENREFQMLFQPIVSLHGNRREQYQTLIRLPGADGRPIPAARFLPIAEKNGHLVKLDQWIVSQALSVIDDRCRKSRPIALFVNQSGPTAEVKENLTRLANLIETRGVDPSALIVEFKLPEIVHRLKAAVGYCAQLEKIGVSVALGGFDGSSSAFQVLEHLCASYIKLPNVGAADGDKMFGMDLKSTIDRLHNENKLVIIPAIEDAKTAAKLWPTGVDFIQGNFVQKPEAGLGYQF